MKKVISVLIATLLVSNLLLAQKEIKEGVLIYEQKINVHANLKGAQKAFKSMIPEFISSDLEMKFNDSQARIKELPKEQTGGIMISSSSANMLIDKAAGKSYSFSDLGGAKYYTEENIDNETKLKPKKDTKVIDGYTCKCVILETKEMNFTIWYTETLPAGYSPIGYLPIDGMVLEIEGKKVSYLFKSLEEKVISDSDLIMPEGYKKVTQEQLEDLTEEQMEELQQSIN
jgi:GLPGLI family protein